MADTQRAQYQASQAPASSAIIIRLLNFLLSNSDTKRRHHIKPLYISFNSGLFFGNWWFGESACGKGMSF